MADIGKPTKTVQVSVTCKKCDGSGFAPGKTKPKCTRCKGAGKVTLAREIGEPK